MAPDMSSLIPVRPWLTVVGIGEDGRAGLSAAALRALEEAVLVVGGRRHLALAAPLKGETRAWPSPFDATFPEILARRGEPVCVLASGDPFHHGVGSLLARLVAPHEMMCLPQPSAFSLAAARLGWALQDCVALSLHGRMLERIRRYLTPRARILLLSWDETTPEKLAGLLSASGFGGSRLHVLEAMGGPRERIRATTAGQFDLAAIDPLNMIALDVEAGPDARVIPLAPGLDDDWFESDGQITKAEIRALALSALRPAPGARLWDIGAGSGSVAIEWTLRHPANTALAVEMRADRAVCIAHNARLFGAEGLRVVEGNAPDVLEELPAPDAIFIGGGLTMAGVFEAAWAALSTGGRLVAHAVTAESEVKLHTLFSAHGGTLKRFDISRLEPLGGFHSWRPARPVTQWQVMKP